MFKLTHANSWISSLRSLLRSFAGLLEKLNSIVCVHGYEKINAKPCDFKAKWQSTHGQQPIDFNIVINYFICS